MELALSQLIVCLIPAWIATVINVHVKLASLLPELSARKFVVILLGQGNFQIIHSVTQE